MGLEEGEGGGLKKSVGSGEPGIALICQIMYQRKSSYASGRKSFAAVVRGGCAGEGGGENDERSVGQRPFLLRAGESRSRNVRLRNESMMSGGSRLWGGD